MKRIDCESNRMVEAIASGQLAPLFRAIPAALLSFLLLAPGLAAGGNEPAPKPASAQPTVLKVHYGDESYTWFVPAGLMSQYLASTLPDHERGPLLRRLEQACDFQGLAPADSQLCFRPPQQLETEAEFWERSRRSVESKGLAPDRERQFLEHLERRYQARRAEDAARGVRVNPCDGTGAPPAAPVTPGKDPIEQAAGSAFVLLGTVEAVTPGWNPTGVSFATAVTLTITSILRQPEGLEIKDEMTLFERRASFDVDRLRICTGPDAEANSQVGMTVVVVSDDWSSSGDLLLSALVYEVRDGNLSHELVVGGEVREKPTVDQLLAALSEAR